MQMQIFVKTMCGQRFGLDVLPTDTIAAVKAKIHREKGFGVDTQRLTFGSKILDDHRTLAEYNVQADSALHLVFRLIGGF